MKYKEPETPFSQRSFPLSSAVGKKLKNASKYTKLLGIFIERNCPSTHRNIW